MRKFILVFLIILLSACASTPVHHEKAVLVPKDRIYYQSTNENQNKTKGIFVRDRGIQGNMVYAHLFINGVRAASLDVGERVDFVLVPGEYIFTVKPTDPLGMTISDSIGQTLYAGKNNYYRIFFDGNSWRIQRVHPNMQNDH